MADVGVSRSSSMTFEGESFVLMGKEVIDILGLECDVCNEMFDAGEKLPKLLPCHHTVCLHCLKNIAEARHGVNYTQNPGGSFEIECPKCRAKKSIEIVSLPNDFRAVKGLDTIKKAKSMFKNVCFKHNCQKLERFCGTCVCPVCPDCVRLDHNEEDSHNIVDLEVALEENGERFDEINEKCKESLTKMQRKKDVIVNVKRHLDVKETEEINNIVQKFDSYKEMLLKRQESLIKMIQEKVKQRKREIDVESSGVCESMRELQEFYDGFKTSRENENVFEIFKMQKKFMDEENEMLKVLPNEELCKSFEFKAVNEERLKTNMTTIGDLQTRLDVTMLSDA